MGWKVERSLVLNISPDISDSEKRKTLHHEIFHLVQKLTTMDTWRKIAPALRRFARVSISDENEAQAELFAYLLVDPQFTRSISLENIDIQANVKLLLQFVQNVTNLAIDTSLRQPLNEDALIANTYAYDHQQTQETLARQKAFVSEQTQNPDGYIVVGLPNSGLEIFSELINNRRTEKPIQVITCEGDINDTIKECQDKNWLLQCIARSPTTFMAERFHENEELPDQSMKTWLAVYEPLMEMACPFLRYEDMVVMDLKSINKFLAPMTLDLEYSDLVTHDQTSYNMIVPYLSQVWALNRSKLSVHYFDYSNQTCED